MAARYVLNPSGNIMVGQEMGRRYNPHKWEKLNKSYSEWSNSRLEKLNIIRRYNFNSTNDDIRKFIMYAYYAYMKNLRNKKNTNGNLRNQIRDFYRVLSNYTGNRPSSNTIIMPNSMWYILESLKKENLKKLGRTLEW